MPTAKITRQVTVGGVTLSGSATRTEEGLIQHTVTLAAGKSGAISANGVDGLATGHGITGTEIIDVHWTDSAGDHKCRYGITVDSATTNAIVFDDSPAAAGDTLPAEDYAVVVCVQTEIEIDCDANDILMLAAHATEDAHLDLVNDDPASIGAVTLNDGIVWLWNEGEGVANPFIAEDDDVLDKVLASNGGTAAATLNIAILYDSVS
jgi:hypothetical protein